MDPDAPRISSLAFFFQSVADVAAAPSLVAIEVVFFVALLLASGFVSGSEVALFSLNGSAKAAMEKAQDRASLRVLRLLERPRALLITILTLNTLINVSAAILAAVLTAQFAMSLNLSPALLFALEVVALTFVLLVVSEITPKVLATRNATAFSRRVSGPLLLFHRMLLPLSAFLARFTKSVQDRFNTPVQPLSNEDLKAMAEIGEAHGTLEEEERELIHSIVEFGETSVREIFVSRLDMTALPVTATLSEALQIIQSSGHSRLPLFAGHPDNILGILYAKDLLALLSTHAPDETPDWTTLARPAMFVPLGKKLDDLLRDFQQRKMHMAIVVDEYGGTAGLITLEDVLEEIVGDIRDEHDEQTNAEFEVIDDGTFRFDARIDLDDFSDVLGLNLDTADFDFETLGGLIFSLSGSIPKIGDTFTYEGLELKVESTENHRIGVVRAWRLPSDPVPAPDLSE
ncbi:MAG: gliding motility-associated protein GldE [Rhodothermales bacterium]